MNFYSVQKDLRRISNSCKCTIYDGRDEYNNLELATLELSKKYNVRLSDMLQYLQRKSYAIKNSEMFCGPYSQREDMKEIAPYIEMFESYNVAKKAISKEKKLSFQEELEMTYCK